MAVGPLPSDQVARLLRSYRELAKERDDLEALLVKLAPAWAELREVLNELNRVLEGWRAGSGSPCLYRQRRLWRAVGR